MAITSFSEDFWERDFDAVQTQFEVQSFLPEQKDSVKAFFDKGTVFVNLPTGFGKSLIYQCLNIIADVIFHRPRGSSVLVTSPLTPLMTDQVDRTHRQGRETSGSGTNGSRNAVFAARLFRYPREIARHFLRMVAFEKMR